MRKALVAEKICLVNRTGEKYIQSPYGSQPTTTVQSLTGTFSTAAYTTIDSALEVTDEFIVGEHIYAHEAALSQFDIYASRTDEQMSSVVTAIDKWVLNELAENAVGAYTTPAGGFNTAANVNVIMSQLLGKVAGYASAYNNFFLVVENTDIPGIIQAHTAGGFNFADAALNNGWIDNYMGIDIYVVRTGTFIDATTTTASGSKTWTNDEHRVFGVKNSATYAAPHGIGGHDIEVSGKTGREIAVWGFCGFKLWKSKEDLVVDITLA